MVYDEHLLSIFDDSKRKSSFREILGEKGVHTVLRRKKRKFYRLASVKKD